MKREQPFWLTPTRLTTLYIVLFSVSVAVIVSAVYILTKRVIERETDNIIIVELEGLKDDYRLGGLQQLINTLDLRSDNWGRTGAVYMLVNARLRRIAGNIDQWPVSGRKVRRWVEFIITAEDNNQNVAHLVRASIVRVDPYHYLLVGTDITDNVHFFRRFRAAMYWGVGLAALLAALIGYLYARRVGARVHAVAETCQSIMSGNLEQRLAVSKALDEFDSLAVIVNQMLDRLQHQAATLRTTFDSTAHDLRAPLYRIRMQVEQALLDPDNTTAAQAALSATLKEIDRIQSTLTTLLEIARAEASADNAGNEVVNLSNLAREVTELYLPEARIRSLNLTCQPGDAITLIGNRQLFAQVLANLLENALKFVPQDGDITVTVSKTQDSVSLQVADSGMGIPKEKRELMMQPFKRLERDRDLPGSGLGLSLVNAIVGLYQGQVLLEDNAPGLSVCCLFPLTHNPPHSAKT